MSDNANLYIVYRREGWREEWRLIEIGKVIAGPVAPAFKRGVFRHQNPKYVWHFVGNAVR